ncbi:MobC family plasmid mobilization relaxosome protein [Streptomyces sp. NBC_00257]|uniref:MobC family plasmid mobilization relaxosome protein n=1 Tax=unclassified Streptomyces TaxID=2593676 RepID=UPI00224D3915|nr:MULTISPECIES: MobC family plasmid mobilization relaxosome protein [unclassified Streptomyces]MCX4870870.1 MobC family plasmid mobilization relaxosome protein [Streptomyces sp. NBC_00906]MCX4901610.1 MobC family plasmid mobilization relaxosome protein [Streptomyces sp. NBC_00892]MCX5426853.1 MobC family plasmid mobilization relaxosome protein [Streptomyces sp. NBC_00062]
MNANDPTVTTPGQQRDPTTAPGGASCRVRRSYGPSYALAPAQEGGGIPAGPRARAHGDQPDSRHQGAPVVGGEADDTADREQPSLSTRAFPDRKPRRRSRNPSERTRKTTTRLSDTEKAEIVAAAAKRGVTVARFLAAASLAVARGSTTLHTNEQLDTAIDELAALRTALSRIGNNINQIAYVHNTGGQPRPGELDHALTTLTRLLARIDDTADTLVKKRL